MSTDQFCSRLGYAACGSSCMPKDGVCCSNSGYYCEAGWTCSGTTMCVASRSDLAAHAVSKNPALAGIIVGAVVGSVALIAILVVCIRWCCKRSAARKAHGQHAKEHELQQQQQQQPYGATAYHVPQPPHGVPPAGYPMPQQPPQMAPPAGYPMPQQLQQMAPPAGYPLPPQQPQQQQYPNPMAACPV